MPAKELPRFVIYQPDEKEFHICLEVSGRLLRWCSYYPPTPDVRFAREVTRIEDLPAKDQPKNKIFDEGTYSTTKSDTKEAVEKKIAEGVKSKSFSFILNGKILKGRFAFKQNGNSTVIQKFKDKYAAEEDVLSADLVRTINIMVPDFDEKKVKLSRPKKTKPRPIPRPEIKAVEEVTANKKIGNTDYHFAYYTSANEPEICLVTSAKAEVLVLKKKQNEWILLMPANRAIPGKEKEFTRHSKALYDAQNK